MNKWKIFQKKKKKQNRNTQTKKKPQTKKKSKLFVGKIPDFNVYFRSYQYLQCESVVERQTIEGWTDRERAGVRMDLRSQCQ